MKITKSVSRANDTIWVTIRRDGIRVAHKRFSFINTAHFMPWREHIAARKAYSAAHIWADQTIKDMEDGEA